MVFDYKNTPDVKNTEKYNFIIKWLLWVIAFLLVMVVLIWLFKAEPDRQKKITKIRLPLDHSRNKRVEPRYSFYTLLSEEETAVSNEEINTASREELFGNVKLIKYTLQVGSFRYISEAKKLQLKLNGLNIKSRIEKKKVKTIFWNRVVIGPFQSSSQVNVVKRKLSKNNIDVLVTKLKD